MQEQISRRNFVKNLAMSAAAIAAGSAAAAVPAMASEVASGSASVSGSASASGSTSASGSAAASGSASKNRVCQILGIEKPVVQAMMYHLTSPELAAAVSNAGGLGVLCLPEQEDIEATKKLTDKPFAVGVFSYNDDFASMLQDEGIKIVVVPSANIPTYDTDWEFDTTPIESFKKDGFTVICKQFDATMDNALAAQEAGADILAVIGYGAGGCGPTIRIPITSYLTEFVGKIDVPMLAAGCIVDKASASAAAVLGADGAYCGTRFLASTENPAPDGVKQIVVDTKAEDLVDLTLTPGEISCTRTDMSLHCLEMESEGASIEDRDAYSGVFEPMWKAMRDGNYTDYAVGMDKAVNNITSILSAQEIVDDIAAGFGM